MAGTELRTNATRSRKAARRSTRGLMLASVVVALASYLYKTSAHRASELSPNAQPSSKVSQRDARSSPASLRRAPSPAAEAQPRTAAAHAHDSSPRQDTASTGYSLPFAAGPQASVRVAELDEVVDTEDRDAERERLVVEQLSAVLKGGEAMTKIEAECGETLCRVRLEKPANTGLKWDEIDDAIAPVLRGPTLFGAHTEGETGIAYVYFTEPERDLPVRETEVRGEPEDS